MSFDHVRGEHWSLPGLVGSWTVYKVNSICLDFSSPSRPPSSLFFPCSFVSFVLVTTVTHLSSRSFRSLNIHCPSLAIYLVDRDFALTSQLSYTPSHLKKNALPQHPLDAERCPVWCTGSRCPTSWPISYSLLSRQSTTCSGALLRVRK